jgi:hypothetical protein
MLVGRISPEPSGSAVKPIRMQFRFVLPATDVITVLPHGYPCYSYGITSLPWD